MIIFIVGPTAVGKTELALQVASLLKSEIVSCDAMQVYQELDIASAKPSAQELKSIKHHCINLVSVSDEFNVAMYRAQAILAIEDILKRGKTPIVVGGSGMYVSVLLDGIFEDSVRNDELRAKLEDQIKREGTERLHKQLKELDQQAALKIHSNDAKRIVRALEVVLSTSKPISKLQKNRQGLWGKYAIKIFGIERPRAELYRRVEVRVDQMFKVGLEKEIKTVLKKQLSPTAKTLIGIPEVSGYLSGEYDLERAKYLMKLHTRHYVKRQMTWFKRDKRIEWLMLENSINDMVETIIKNVGAGLPGL